MKSRKLLALIAFFSIMVTTVGFLPNQVSAQSTKKVKKLKKNEDPAYIGKRKINGGFDGFTGWIGGSRDKEIALGRQLAAQVEKQAKMIDDPKITEYINRVGQNIVLNSDATIPFTIRVIDSDEVNAFALPGGFFFVNKGLIIAADNEAELAGVMAHEIAHVTARHAMENNGKSTLLNYGILAGSILAGGIGGSAIRGAGGIAKIFAFSKFSRNAEREADVLGVQYLYASGYDPAAMSTMFEKLASQNKKKPNALLKLIATHPQSVQRRDDSLALVVRFPEKEEYVISTSEFQRVKQHLLRISNAGTVSPIDVTEVEEGRPTLKRREPVLNDSSDSYPSSTPSDDGPPKLKRRTDGSSSDSNNSDTGDSNSTSSSDSTSTSTSDSNSTSSSDAGPPKLTRRTSSSSSDSDSDSDN